MAKTKSVSRGKKNMPHEEDRPVPKKTAPSKIFDHVDKTRAYVEISVADANTATEAVRAANEAGVDQIVFAGASDHPSVEIAQRDHGYKIIWHDAEFVVLAR